ncbi:MAG TPA: tRNA (N6-threonylcarbamoyladenosine(37)-N6)-methyltransferase TrmO [Candidatus Wallbacteria bacterium]|nr:tRNA (N6-threonylcarbamoyladenosine(37)-N6)-methyltransferase TrmO [Candidatus Wallbacteria bacterium]
MKEISYAVNPVGIVHSNIYDTSKMPKEGIPTARIEIFDKYIPALHGLEKFSHIYLICFFHKSNRDLLQVDLEKIRFRYDQCTDPPLGVFAGRSPSRPNPVSLTVVKILSINGNVIEVENCDAVEGTPVIDIKPYNGGIDQVMNMVSPTTVPKNRELKLKWVHRIVKNVTGREDSLTWAIAKSFVEAFERGFDYRSKHVHIIVSDVAELVDSAIFLSNATFSSGRITVKKNKRREIIFKTAEKSFECSIAEDAEKHASEEIISGENLSGILKFSN